MITFREFLEQNGFPRWEVSPSEEGVKAALASGRKLVRVHMTEYQSGLEEIVLVPVNSPDELWMRSSECLQFADVAPVAGRSYPQGRIEVALYGKP